MANSKIIHVRCSDCNTIVELEKGLFGWKKESCPKCGKKVSYKVEGQQVVTCAKCRNNVLFDAAKGKDNTCPVCGDFLLGSVHQQQFHELQCPRCGVSQRIIIPEERKETIERAIQKKRDRFGREIKSEEPPKKTEQPLGPWKHVCKACGVEFDVEEALYKENAGDAQKGYVIRYGGEPTDIIWKHPLNKFPFKSQLIVNEGQFALMMKNGVCEYPAGPGNYMLEDSPLTREQKLDAATGDGGEIVFSTDVYFVQSRIQGNFKWGTANPITVEYGKGSAASLGQGSMNVWDTEGKTAAKLQMFGNLAVTVCEPKQFAAWLGYAKTTHRDLTENKDSALCRLVRDEVNNVFNEALPNMINEKGWNPEQLRNNLATIREYVRMAASDALSNYGLAIESFNVESFNVTEDEKSKERRDSKELLRRRVEKNITWEVPDIPVHMRGDATLCADITLGGTFTVRISDMNKVCSLPEAKEWSDKNAPDDKAQRYITNLANHLLAGVFDDVLQSMIDDADADIRELNRYFGHLRRTVNDYLQQAFASRGLYVDDVTIRQNALRESAALAKRTQFASHRSETAADVERRRFDQDTEATQAGEDSAHRMTLKKIGAQETIDSRDIDLKVAQVHEDQEDAFAELARRRKLREHDMHNLDADLQHERRMKEVDRSTEFSMHRISADNAESMHKLNTDNVFNVRRDEIASAKKTRDFDDMYTDWKRTNALQEEKLKASIDQKRISNEARREEEIADQEHRRMLKDIVRKIEESNFDWQQKLDAYDRLCRNNRVRDAIENDVLAAKGEADQMYAREHVKKILSTEEYELLERGRQDSEDRAERQKRADFARDMEVRKFAVGIEMEKLRLEVENQRLRDEAAEREQVRQAEIEKLKATLSHLEAMGKQDMTVQTSKNALEIARAKAEKDYADKMAREEREDARRREENKAKREDQYADRAERLLHDMWGIQQSLQTLKLENERDYNQGRARVDNTFAEYMAKQMDGGKLDELLKYVKQLTEKPKEPKTTDKKDDELNKLLKTLMELLGGTGSTVSPVTPVAPVTPPSPPSGGWYGFGTQPGVSSGAGKTCPNCGNPLGRFDSYCPKCGKHL